MRRTLVVMATAALVLVGLTGAWLAWPAASAPANPGLGLTLLVNLQSRVEITPGTPVAIDLSLGSSRSAPSLQVGSRRQPWHTLVRLEDVEASQGVASRMTRIGPPRSVHVVSQPDGRPAMTRDAPDVAHLEAGRHVHTVSYVIEPEAAAALTPGTHRFRAVLETPTWLLWGWRGRAVSGDAAIVVRDRADDRGEALEAQRLQRTAGHYLRVGRFKEAHAAAASLIALRPRETRSHVLFGDALAGLDRRREALDAYRRAMKLLPPSYEEPRLLMERMARLIQPVPARVDATPEPSQ